MDTSNNAHQTHPTNAIVCKDFIKRRTLGDVTDLMCQEATAHGVGHAWNNRRNGLGVFWFIVTLTLFAFLLYVAFTICADFMAREIQSQTSVKLKDTKGLQLPSLVLCNRAFFSRRKLQAMGISQHLTHYLIASIGTTSVLREFGQTEMKVFLQEGHTQLLHLLGTRNLTFFELIHALSYTCEEMLLQCVFGSRRLTTSECCARFLTVRTMTGLCHMHLASSRDIQLGIGEHMGFTVYLNITKDDWPDLDPRVVDISYAAKAGLQATLTSNHTHPGNLVIGNGFIIQPRVLTSSSVTLTAVRDVGVKTMLDISEHPCLPLSGIQPSPGLQNLLNKQPNCDLGATRSCLRRLCNCTVFSLSFPGDNRPLCALADKIHCQKMLLRNLNQGSPPQTTAFTLKSSLSAKKCLAEAHGACRRVCERHDFTSATSHLTIPQNLYQYLPQEFNITNRSDVAILTVFYSDLIYTEVKIWRNDLLLFLCKLGGYTGIILGCSIVTFFEFFVYFALVVSVLFKNLRFRHKAVRPDTKLFLHNSYR